MRKTWKLAVLAGLMFAGAAGVAAADSRVRFNVSVGIPTPVAVGYEPVYYPYPAPAVVYAPPAPVYYYYPPAAYYSPPVRVIYTRHPHWRHHHHRHWR